MRGYRHYEFQQEQQQEAARQRGLLLHSPRPVTTTVVRPNAALLSGDKAKIDAFADEMLRRERAGIAAEQVSEGRIHVNTRPQRHE